MTSEERQANLNNISPEDLAKIQAVTEKSITIDAEDLLVAEFALRFGWQAYLAYEKDLVTSEQMSKLLVASRKLDSLAQYRAAQATFIGTGSVNAKSPGQAFDSLTRKLVKDAEPDE